MFYSIFVINYIFEFSKQKTGNECRLRLQRMMRIKDYLMLEEEFIQNQEAMKPAEDRYYFRENINFFIICWRFRTNF